MRTRSVAILLAALSLIAVGCATKKFVREEVGKSEAKLGADVGRVEGALSEERTRTTTLSDQLGQTRTAVQQADNRAGEATNLARMAQGRADEAGTKAGQAQARADEAHASAGQALATPHPAKAPPRTAPPIPSQVFFGERSGARGVRPMPLPTK